MTRSAGDSQFRLEQVSTHFPIPAIYPAGREKTAFAPISAESTDNPSVGNGRPVREVGRSKTLLARLPQRTRTPHQL